MKTYTHNNILGCVVSRKNRSTGTTVSLYNGHQAGLDTDDGNTPWSTVCEDHGYIIAHRTISLAMGWLSHPEDWCENCMEKKENAEKQNQHNTTDPGSQEPN